MKINGKVFAKNENVWQSFGKFFCVAIGLSNYIWKLCGFLSNVDQFKNIDTKNGRFEKERAIITKWVKPHIQWQVSMSLEQ